MYKQAITKAERNYSANFDDIQAAVNVFRKTDGVETLVQHLAAFLTPDQFRMLWILEMDKIPLQVIFKDKDGNIIEEKEATK